MTKDVQVSQPLEARERWIDDEPAGCEFANVRHGKRLSKLLEQISMGQAPVYRGLFRIGRTPRQPICFFANGRVNGLAIMGGHF
jgi:hypothetical protein